MSQHAQSRVASDRPVLSARHLRVTTADGRALIRDLSLDITAGEIVALVGESGSGKSLTALSIMRLLPTGLAATGAVEITTAAGTVNTLAAPEAELCRIRGRDISLVFQDPLSAFNPRMRIGDHLLEAVRLHRNLPRRAAREQAASMLARVGIEAPAQRMRDYPHQLSGGQRQRAMIAAALVNRPALLIADEPTTAVDAVTQKLLLDLLLDVRAEFGTAILFITHDLIAAAQIATRVAVMFAGRLVEIGPAARVLNAPAHPYTRALLAAHPSRAHSPRARLPEISATVGEFTCTCAFSPRCELRIERCDRELPQLVETPGGGSALCFRAGEAARATAAGVGK